MRSLNKSIVFVLHCSIIRKENESENETEQEKQSTKNIRRACSLTLFVPLPVGKNECLKTLFLVFMPI